MADDRDRRLEELVGDLVARHMGDSLGRIEEALAAWRRGELELLLAHGEILRHVARVGALSTRVARAGVEGPERLLRDAFDAGLLDADELRRLTGRAPEEIEPSPPLDTDAEAAERGEAPAPPDKRVVAEKLLRDGPVLVHLDARRPGVMVPAAHAEEPVLRLGYGLTPPIHDLALDETGVCATLSFGGAPFTCVLPWTAIYAVVGEDGRGLVWPADVPPEAERKGAADEAGAPPADDRPPPAPRRGGHLRLV